MLIHAVYFHRVIWVECKYRSGFDRADNITVDDYQLHRYRLIQRESRRKVLVAIGIGGKPDSPQSFYLMPLDSIEGENISRAALQQFLMSAPAENFAPHVADYFRNKVFQKKRQS